MINNMNLLLSNFNGKQHLLLILGLLFYFHCNSQVNAILLDSITNEPIPYTNVWIENENIGTTSDENGHFTLNKVDSNQFIIFSAIGYAIKRLNIINLPSKVVLSPQITELNTVIVTAKKSKQEKIIGKFKKSKIREYFSAGETPWITARFFPFKDEYQQTPFLKIIRINTESDVKNSIFNIRLYSVGKNGQPFSYLYDKNIIGKAKKGNKVTTIDVSKLKISFPVKGFFIAMEWLIIPTNKYEYKTKDVGTKRIVQRVSYEPSVGTIPSESAENSWIFSKGSWNKVWNFQSSQKIYKNKYNLMAVELTLSN